MRIRFFLLLLFLCSAAFGQQPVYKDFEVDSAANPRGGMAFLTTFLQTNLRKPIPAEAEGLSGRVILNGIVEPDGRISGVNVARSLRPDLDREAVRVFSLFNAWKPATKGGQAVRQQVTMPVSFVKNEPFTYQNGAKLSYFGADFTYSSDSTQARYKQIAPIDTEGIPAGDIVIYEKKGKSWQEVNRLPGVHKIKSYQTNTGKWVNLIGCQNADLRWENLLMEIDEDGNRVRQAYYQNGKRVGESRSYYPGGLVAQKVEPRETNEVITSWYSNGQIRQIRKGSSEKLLGVAGLEQVIAFWDSTGQQLVANGNGQAILTEHRKSCADTIRYTDFIEQGSYKDGLKHGDWIGRYADGSYFYKETYADGTLKEGKNRTGQSDTVRYTVLEQQPEFPGGMPGLGKFLSENLRYPVEAQKAGAEGKVFVSFVVCTDGTLCDYEVLKGVRRDIDQEAVRVVKKMSGRWKPGVQRGQKVRVKYNLPINFALQ